MISRFSSSALCAFVLIFPVTSFGATKCIPAPSPPRPPVLHSGLITPSRTPVRILNRASLSDTWKAARQEIATIEPDTMVELLEDMVVVDVPDIVRVTKRVDELALRKGDQILRYAALGEGWADLWAAGCWYENVDGSFITEPDGTGCGGERCLAKMTKPGRQTWWIRIRLPGGKTGWTLSRNLDLAD